jgi:hypothetical protein
MKTLKTFVSILIVSLTMPSALALTTAEQIEAIDALMARSGYYPTQSNNYSSKLTKSSSANSTMQGSAGTTYAVAAVCDDDCGDIDVEVSDKYGDTVGKDNDSSYLAVTNFKANYSGNYTIKTTMYNCSTSYCIYRLKVYAQR